MFAQKTDYIKTVKLNQKFCYVVAGALLFIAVFQYFLKHKNNIIITVIAVLLLLLTTIKPMWLTPVRIVWDKIGHVLGIINTYVFLSIFYIFILTPVGLLMRLFGKDILKSRRSAIQTTYWEPAPEIEESKMENQF